MIGIPKGLADIILTYELRRYVEERREPGQRYGLITEIRAIVKRRYTNKKGYYWCDTKTGQKLGSVLSNYEGLTYAAKGVKLTAYEKYAVGYTITTEWSSFKDKKTVVILPYHGDHDLTVWIDEYRSYIVIGKRKAIPKGGS